ncbi:kelch-like protein 26 [Dreissena polymorpha]|uniref:kelch-like protein 26 n=1 Tax=Dreissena polymorpha TaxID=45954 RepID=UPI002264D628|nr:kelch-like protein 26 [Dreissena polymorpha]XP_052230122.1 kelch-like protein 26 [Dreissena polymorpha]XP_052230123.1 kelch-like protein 26 [Dreissena polymorpha]
MVLQGALSEGDAQSQITFEDVSHGGLLMRGLNKLRDQKQLFDVVLIVENERLPAHRVVLASCSDYFRAMFTNGLIECSLDEICLNGVTAMGMRALIDFAYSSTVDINEGNVEHVLCAANHVQLLPVVQACVSFLKSNISISYCVELLNLAELFDLHDLQTFVYTFISQHFSVIGMSAEFLKLSASQLEALLQMDCPVNCSESDVFSIVIGWIVHHHGYNWDGADRIVCLVHIENIDIHDLQKIPNYSVFEKLFKESIVFKNLLNIIDKNSQKCYSPHVPGLINLRGYTECVVTCGGFRPDLGMSNSVEWVDNDAGGLQYITSVPHVDQCNFGLAVINNRMYVIGGCYNDDQMEEIVHGFGFCYDPMDHTWMNIPPMKNERCRFYLGAVGKKLYAIGGDPSASMDIGDFAQCECFDTETHSWKNIASLPGNRMEHAGTSFGNSLYISGGLQDNEGPVFNTFFKYDTEADIWLQLSSMLTPRADHTMLTYKGAIYVVGGWFEDDLTHQRVLANSVDRFDLQKGQWEIVTVVNQPRLFASYTLLDQKVYIVGGWLNGDCQRKCNTVEILDLDLLTLEVKEGLVERGQKVSQELWEHTACRLWLPNTLLKPSWS